MKPWTWKWFQSFIAFLRKWDWFDKWGYGNSKGLEDFVRNPFERLRDEKFPFAIKGIDDTTAILLRLRYIPYDVNMAGVYGLSSGNPSTYHAIYPAPKREIKTGHGLYRHGLVIDKWVTKYPNAGLMIQVILSYKHHVPIPFISCNIRFSNLSYFQFGLGWGPQWANYDGSHPGDPGQINAVLCGKFRFVRYEDESKFNPSDVYGYFEGEV